ncbi:4Fe-4S binding protein [Ilyobacter sp.]|uniref:4Fe-4S binding protein n=1 Tax=Ilyobacter sp. TaxID=3100343 RepID=UPI003569F809
MRKKIQIIRNSVQLAFIGLLISGLFMKFKAVFPLLLIFSLVVGNFFCGWVCPYGALQEFFGAIGDRIFRKKYKMPQNIQKYLMFSRYIVMVLLVAGIGVGIYETINGNKTFTSTVSDFSGAIISVSLLIMASFLIVSTVFERPFCNYLCIEGTKFGIASLTRFFSVKRNKKSCVNCKKCNKVCPMNIAVSDKDSIRNPQCINCFKCISSCPVKDTLSYGKIGMFLRKNRK